MVAEENLVIGGFDVGDFTSKFDDYKPPPKPVVTIQDLQQKVDALQSENLEFKSQFQALDAEYDQLCNERRHLEAERTKLREELEQCKSLLQKFEDPDGSIARAAEEAVYESYMRTGF